MGNSLRALRTKRGWTHDQAASEMGVSRGQFIKLERGERGLTERTIALAAKAFGVPRAAVIDDEAQPNVGSHPNGTPVAPNVRLSVGGANPDLAKLKGPRDVPVLGTGVCGDDGDFRFNGQTIDYAPRPPGIEGKKDVFVVYVVGDSMAERYEDGDPLYVDPHRRPKPRDIVIVELKAPMEGEAGSAFVKRLVRRGGGKIVVEQFNPPKELVFDEDDVLRLHRVIPWTELIGM
ncbi:helix-turn-helix transcriptional regulator [Methylobacterium sp. NMS12]|uniref:helix-turn-helix domain-containing protein n=1 Tax=Methylobacterium sp. NMS12 TaxID=3079766 RepID=UPI003F88162A